MRGREELERYVHRKLMNSQQSEPLITNLTIKKTELDDNETIQTDAD